MSKFPQTRISLILRLAQPDDVLAWHEFAELYTPALYQLSIRQGLQNADAEDITQDILCAVARAAGRFEQNASKARFRTWLYSVARHLIADFFSGRAKRPLTLNMSDSWLKEFDGSEADCEFLSSFQLEVRRSAFQVAAKRVRSRVAESSWQAFELTQLQQLPVAEVAQRLGLSPGALYVARCRVMKLLRTEVQTLELPS